MKKNRMRWREIYHPVKKILRVMKLSLFLFLLSMVQVFANTTYAQETRLSVNFENTEIERVLLEIENRSSFKFIYNKENINVESKVNIHVDEQSIRETLNQLFAGHEIDYNFYGNQIILTKSAAVISQDNMTITGKVTDTSRSPLPGVTVVIKGTTHGTITDIEGNYVLAGISANDILMFSFVGMKTQEILITTESTVDVKMQEEAVGIEEVVAIGYGSVKKSDLTGSVSHIESSKITETKSADPISSLKGRVAGIDITNSETGPGSSASFVIRGYNSLNDRNEPLIVLDGVPFQGSITDINNSEIKSIDVLKDASSTAIYGARGANGVIIITTKRGEKDSGLSVTYDGYFGVSRNFSRFDMMDGDQYTEFKRAAYPEFSEDELIFSKTELNAIQNREYTDWQDLMFDGTGFKTDHNVMVNFNSGKSSNLFSVGYFKDQSIIKNMSFERINLKLAGDIEFNDKLSAGYTIMSSFSNRDLGENGVFFWGTALDPLSTPYDENGDLQFYPSEWNQTVLQSNPLYDLEDENLERVDKRNSLIINAFARWKILDGLTYQLVVAPEIGNNDYGRYFGKQTIARQNGTNSSSWEKANAYSINVNNKLNYTKQFDDHKLDVSLLYDFQQYKHSSILLSGEDIPYFGKWYNVDESPERFSRNSNYRTWSILSYMGRLNYSYKGKYLLTATGRYDGASVLTEGNKWDFFPSLAFAWRLSEEPFLKAAGTFDNLKLRASWGNSGNSVIDEYSTLGALNPTRYVFGNSEVVAPGYVASELPNSSLGWEKTEEYNLGLDFAILNYRISGSVDGYVRNTSDLLMPRQLPITSGYNSTMQNIGKTRNKGIELSLNTVPISRSDFKWSVDFTASYNKNEIVQLYGGNEDDPGNKWFIGQPIYVEWIYQFDGIWQLGEEQQAQLYGAVPGDTKFKDVNEDKVYDSSDYGIYNTIPKYNVGLNTRFEYKDFDLTLNFYGRLDYGARIDVLVNQGGRSSARYGQLDINYWTPDNPSNEAPKPAKTEGDERVGNSTYAYRDLSFIRLNNIILGYNIKNKGNFPFRNARAYLSVDNPYVFTFEKDFEGLDPENATSFSAHRPLVTFILGLNINF